MYTRTYLYALRTNITSSEPKRLFPNRGCSPAKTPRRTIQSIGLVGHASTSCGNVFDYKKLERYSNYCSPDAGRLIIF